MSALQRLPVIATTLATAAAILALPNLPAVRSLLARHIGLSAPGNIWRIIAVVLALLNLKVLPFVWHIRIVRGIFKHLYFQRQVLPPRSLFEPLITSTHTSLGECDYNLHKSNSTYFSDLDISRAQLVSCLIKRGLERLNKGDTSGLEGAASQVPKAQGKGKAGESYIVALGGVSCAFKREIKPFQRYEIWTRVLCWDRKWLYLVSHIVRKNTVKPIRYTLQPWRRSSSKSPAETEEDVQRERERIKGAILASSIAKYVVKKGRLTIPPELVLLRSELLPPRSAPSEPTPPPSGTDTPITGPLSSPEEALATLTANADGAETPRDGRPADGDWTWDAMEKERLRGLKLAEMFGALDGLHDEFTGGMDGALGEYADLLW
ncbi:hypothetical protein B0A49_02081 [Cryomyces minteri]|uniref:Capsule polysaccharide biosynthesis protein n=1 Tax=Cryomyces minteri TaxID=331657 RepID=A0A4U0XGQ0_9PEZI|nr:hypothetical protein B0A49_02081 [Cryomyces minteri]